MAGIRLLVFFFFLAGSEVPDAPNLAPIREALRSQDPVVRAKTALAVRDPRLIPDLGALVGDPVPGVRAAAVAGLTGLRTGEAYPFLLAATADAEGSVAEVALAALAARRDPRAVPRVARLVGSTQPGIRAAAARALVVLGGLPAHREMVDRALSDPEPRVPLAVLDGFRENPAPEAIPYLERLVASPDARIRKGVALALASSRNPRARAPLRKLLRDHEPEIRAMAVAAIGDLHDPSEAGRLASMAGDPSEAVRVVVARSLGDCGNPAETDALLVLAKDPYAPVRLASVASAVQLGGTGALEVLDVARGDEDVRVRLETVRGLGAVGSAPALARLRDEASRGAGVVTIAAIEQLGARRDPGAAPILERLLDSPDEPVRIAAREALFAIRTER